MKIIKSYTELSKLKTFEERYNYLKNTGTVGESTFGYDRYLNQYLYKSKKWRLRRNDVIIRDNGCDLGDPDYEINDLIIVHHINPITVEDIENDNPCVYDMDNLICTSKRTHDAIHFGDESLLPNIPLERKPGDTCPWK